MKLPKVVSEELISLLADLPVEVGSDQWRAIQMGIAMLTSPTSFKKGVHVFLNGSYKNHFDGTFDDCDMSIKIYPYKIVLRREHSQYNREIDVDIHKIYRYIYPHENYTLDDFEKVMEDYLSLMWVNEVCDNSSESYCTDHTASHFTATTNIKFS